MPAMKWEISECTRPGRKGVGLVPETLNRNVWTLLQIFSVWLLHIHCMLYMYNSVHRFVSSTHQHDKIIMTQSFITDALIHHTQPHPIPKSTVGSEGHSFLSTANSSAQLHRFFVMPPILYTTDSCNNVLDLKCKCQCGKLELKLQLRRKDVSYMHIGIHSNNMYNVWTVMNICMMMVGKPHEQAWPQKAMCQFQQKQNQWQQWQCKICKE